MSTIRELRQSRDAIVEALIAAGAKVRGNRVRCPLCDDKKPSGGIYQSKGNGQAWKYKCHKCGFQGDVFDLRSRVSNKPLGDVLREAEAAHRPPEARSPAGPATRPKAPPTFDTIEAIQTYCQKAGDVRAVYRYDDEAGQPWGAVVRIETATGKTFKQFRAIEQGRYELGAPAKPWKLYNLPNVIEAETVVVVEGEKAADALIQLGYVATTSLCGAGKAAYADWSPLRGKQIYLWPDHDSPGYDHMAEVVAILERLRPTPHVAIIAPEDVNLTKEKEDAANLVSDMIRVGIEPQEQRAMVDAALKGGKALTTSGGTVEQEHNRTLTILKARHGPGTYARIAMNFDSETLQLDELGWITKRK